MPLLRPLKAKERCKVAAQLEKQTGLPKQPRRAKPDPKITDLPDPIMAVNPDAVMVSPCGMAGNPHIIHSSVPVTWPVVVIAMVPDIDI